MKNKTAEEKFMEKLEEASERVNKMPQWKKEGWAILDENPDYKYKCNNEESEPKPTNPNSKIYF